MGSVAQKSENSIKQPKTYKLFQTAQKEVKPLQAFFQKFNNDWSMTFSGALAYSLLMAMFPIAVAIVAILGFAIGAIRGNPQQGEAYLQTILNVIPAIQGQQSIAKDLTDKLSQSAGFLAVIAIVFAIFGGSRLFIAIEGCMGIIYRVRPRPVIKQNMVAIAMMIVFILLIPIMVFAATLPSAILGFLNTNPQLKSIPFFSSIASNGITVQLVGYIGGLIAAFLLFETIYFVVPNQKISIRNSWRGAIVSAILLEIFIALFPLYTTRFLGSYVGQVGFAAILLVFFYYFAVILILGAEVNAFFFEGVHPLPNDLVTFVTTMAGKVNQDRPSIEADSHVNSKPTELADNARIAKMRQHEEQIQQENLHKQQSIATRMKARDQAQEEKKAAKKHSSKLPTMIAVALGTVLTFILELRQHHK